MKKLFALMLTICLSSQAFALNWQMVGARHMAMGGAGVATANGTLAQYYNPALLAVNDIYNKHNEISFNFGLQAETSKALLDATKKLMDMSDQYKKVQYYMSSTGANTHAGALKTVFEGMGDINDIFKNDLGVLTNADAGLGFKFGNFAVSARSLGSMSALPVIDRQNLILKSSSSGFNFSSVTTSPAGYGTEAAALSSAISSANIGNDLKTLISASTNNPTSLANIIINSMVDAGSQQSEIQAAVSEMVANMPAVANLINGISSSGGLYSDNQTRVMADMAVFSEAALGYGFNLVHGISLGANVKVIEGTTAQTGIFILSDDMGVGDVIKEAWNNKKFSTNWGVDLGAAVNFSELFQADVFFNPQVGITARNINSPKFKRPKAPTGWTLPWNQEDYKLKPQIRAGAAINPFTKRLTLTADIDLNENETVLQNYKSRQLSAGLEVLTIDDYYFKLPLRFGVNKNLAQSDAPMYFTAGFATVTPVFTFELAAAIGDGTEKVDNKDIPNAAALSMNFAWFF